MMSGREVRHVEQPSPLVLVGLADTAVQLRDLFADAAHLRFQFDALLAVFPLLPDFLAQPVAVGVVGLELGFERAPPRVALQDSVNGRLGVGPAARGETGLHEIGLFADEADVEHGGKAWG